MLNWIADRVWDKLQDRLSFLQEQVDFRREQSRETRQLLRDQRKAFEEKVKVLEGRIQNLDGWVRQAAHQMQMGGPPITQETSIEGFEDDEIDYGTRMTMQDLTTPWDIDEDLMEEEDIA